MKDPQAAAELFTRVFERLHHERMAGLPLLNPKLQVETFGFQEHGGRIVGVLITPWLMCLVMLPSEKDDWSGMEPGRKQPHDFPGGTYKFMVNEVDDIGHYQAHSLYSPMHEFTSRDHALAAAESFLKQLMAPREGAGEDPVDEELLGRVMRGEETPEIHRLETDQAQPPEMAANPARGPSDIGVRVEEKRISRRDLLRGFLDDT